MSAAFAVASAVAATFCYLKVMSMKTRSKAGAERVNGRKCEK